jgi:hypothetical protein
MDNNSLLGNAIFFLLDIVATIVLIPMILTLMKRDKIKHLTEQTLTAVNELMEIGGTMMMKFNDAAFGINNVIQSINKMSEEEREKKGFGASKMIEYQKENLEWFQQFSQAYEKELNSFESTIELFSPHFDDAELLILISKLNQNARYSLSSMEAISMSIRLGSKIPDDVFGSINGAYKKMYNDVVVASKKKKFKLLRIPKTIEELYGTLPQY